MPFEARPADEQALLPLWTRNLPAGRGDLAARLQWFYREGPHGNGQAYVVQDGDEPIGAAGIGVRTWFEGGRDRPLRAALFADLAVEGGYRSGLPALVLLRELQSRVVRDYDLGYAFPEAKAVSIYRRAGCRFLGEMPRYVRIVRSEPHLRAKLGWLAVPAAAIVDRSLASVAAIHARGARAYELHWPADFDERFDALWEEASRTQRIACQRTHAFLHWRFAKCPEPTHRIVTLERRGALRGYAVLDVHEDRVEIRDLLAATDSACDALLSLLVPACAHLGASAIGMRFLGTRRIANLLERHGFSRRPHGRIVLLATERTEMHDLESWYLTDLDDYL